MLNHLFQGIFDSANTTNTASTTTSTISNNISVSQFLICIAAALVIGIFLALVYTYKTRYTLSFLVTLATLPAIVSVVIMMVNGNVGAGVAVAGAFSLVRFRSAPGTAKEIGTIFLAMGTGLMVGMGYLGFAVLFALILGLAMLLFNVISSRFIKNPCREKLLTITIPEDLNYGDVFDDLFAEYTESCDVISVKTSNMGSLFKLKYNITLKNLSKEKEFIDALRCRNGNLEVCISRQEVSQYEL